MKKYILLLIFSACLFLQKSMATHLVGGEMSYRCLGGNQYEITLTIFRDDYYGQATLDPTARITIFRNGSNSVLRTEDINLLGGGGTILPLDANPCITNRPRDVRIEKGIYKKVITLPANTLGYKIVYQRCCRNDAAANINNGLGSTYMVNIPNTNLCNNSPTFDNQPPLFLCANSKLDFDMSATDADGDQLVYSLVAPLQGLDEFSPRICDAFDGCNLQQSAPPPYDSIYYLDGYTSQEPLGPTSTIYINPTTGILTTIPKTVGLFVVGIQVQEIRAGVVLSSNIRDFQFNVTNCSVNSSVPIVITDNSPNSAIQVNDTTFSNCQGNIVRFDNDVNQRALSYFWDFGVPSLTNDTSNLKNPTYTYADTGTYYVTLIINKGNPCSDTSRIKVVYYPGLNTNFGFTGACQNDLIQLSDSSSSPYNDVNHWQWILSAGDTSYVKNPTTQFNTSGTFPITLISSTSRGCVGKTTKNINVNPKPKAAFAANFLCYRHNANFTDASTITSGTITRYHWNFGDGFSDTLKNASHTYNVFADSFAVRHIVTSSFGCKDTIIKKIKMDDTVKISYTTSPASLCENIPITFTNTSSGGNPTAFQWIINNGAPINGNTATVTFPNSGTYLVKLISTNRCGNDTLTKTITINAGPSINLGADVVVCNKSTKTITALGAFDSVRWNTNATTSSIILDGNKSPIAVSVYKNGCFNKDTVLVQKQIITPNFSNNFLCINKPIQFSNTTTINFGTIQQYDWKFGDGQFANNIQHPAHAYATFGNYNVQLIATSTEGCKDTIVKSMLTDSLLLVDFSTAETISCQRKAVNFINQTNGGVNNQYIWKIEHNQINTKNTTYTFLGTGLFPVKLIASNRCNVDSITKNIRILPRPNVSLGRDTILCKHQTTTFSVNAPSYDSIRWVNGSTSATQITDGSINPFKVKVYVDGCVAEDTVQVVAPKFILQFSNDFICYQKPIILNNTSTISQGSIANYHWNFGDGQTLNGIKNPTHTYTHFGPKTIELIATASLGACKDTIKKPLVMDDSISFSIRPTLQEICYGLSVQYTNQSSGGVNTNYTWTLNNSQAQTGNTASYTHVRPGANVIQLIASHRCGADSTKYSFSVLPLPRVNLGADSIIMCPGELKMIGINQASDSIFWSTGERNVDSIAINGLQSPIRVQVYKNGCLATDSIMVSTNCDVFIPTAFSPNNDGYNDAFNMMNKSVKEYTLKVFNRWGELVFETNDLNNSWNGMYKGAPCPVDSYTYIATGKRFNEEVFYLKGTVSLLR